MSTPTSLSFATYRHKVLGCWLGKAVGGTLGGPVEGDPGPLNLCFYDPVPSEMLPNDDLDLQVIWLETLRRHGLPLDRSLLAQAWLDHVHMWPDEYGVASRNLTMGLAAPVSGSFDNGFTAGMGAAIRTELWACLAPGEPALAARLAREDACVDHIGEGLYAAVYLATLQSLAFIDSDRERLLDAAAAAIPADCRVAKAVADTRKLWAECRDWRAVRLEILARHGRQNFTDVAQNLAFTVLGWLAGKDFGDAICIAVNCGEDTDCTGATLGALLGILDPDGISEKWLAPIGRDLVLSPAIVGAHHAPDLAVFTDQVAAAAVEVLAYYGAATRFAGAPVTEPLPPARTRVAIPAEGALIATSPLVVMVHYPAAVALRPGQPATVRLELLNPQTIATQGSWRASVPFGWQLVSPELAFDLAPGQSSSFDLTITPPAATEARHYRNPLDLHGVVNGIACSACAGLVQTMPWRTADGTALEVAGHFIDLPAGPFSVTTEVKIPWNAPYRIIAQAPRAVRILWDGELLHSHDGSYGVPAIHRPGPTAANVPRIIRGWHTLTVEVAAGASGQLFTCIGDAGTWDWLRNAEFRLPS